MAPAPRTSVRELRLDPGGIWPASTTWARAEPEPQEQQHQWHHEAADPVDDERGAAVDVPDQPAEVLPEEAGDEGERQEDRGQDSELLDGGVLLDADVGLLDRDHGHVGLQDRAEQVALGGYLLVDREQVIPDIADIVPQLLIDHALDRAGHREQRVDGAVEASGLAAQRVDPLGWRRGAGEHGGLDLVDVTFQP